MLAYNLVQLLLSLIFIYQIQFIVSKKIHFVSFLLLIKLAVPKRFRYNMYRLLILRRPIFIMASVYT